MITILEYFSQNNKCQKRKLHVYIPPPIYTKSHNNIILQLIFHHSKPWKMKVKNHVVIFIISFIVAAASIATASNPSKWLITQVSVFVIVMLVIYIVKFDQILVNFKILFITSVAILLVEKKVCTVIKILHPPACSTWRRRVFIWTIWLNWNFTFATVCIMMAWEENDPLIKG